MAIRTAAFDATNALSNVNYDGSTASIARYVAVLDGLDKAQQKATLSSLGLSKQQQQEILGHRGLIGAVKGLTVAQVEEAIGRDKGMIATILSAKATDELTFSMLKAAMASDKLDDELLEQILKLYAYDAAVEQAAGSTDKLKGGFLAAFKSMGTMDWVSLAISAIPLLIEGITWLYDTIVTTSDEYKEMFKEAKSEYDETKGRIEELNEQIATNRDRLSELYDLLENDKISIVEEEELQTLKEANKELELQILHEKELAAIRAGEANENLVNAYNTDKEYSELGDEYINAQIKTLENAHSELISKWRTVQSGGIVEWAEGEQEAASKVMQQLTELEIQISEWDGKLSFDERYAEAVEIYSELLSKQKEGLVLATEEQDIFEQARTTLVEMEGALRNNYLAQYIGEDANTEKWQGMIDGISKLLYFEEYVSGKLALLPTEINDALSAIASDGVVGGEEIERYATRVQQLDDWMEAAGITAAELAKYLTAVSKSAAAGGDGGIYTAETKPITEVSEQYEKILEVMNSAMAEMALSGKVSGETIGSLAEITDNYNDYLYVENGLLKINTDKLRELAGVQFTDQTDELEKSIASYERQNVILEEQITLIESNRDARAEEIAYLLELGEAGEKVYNDIVASFDNYIESIRQSIKANEDYIKSLQDTITQFENLEKQWASTLGVYDGVHDSLKSLAEAEELVADGYTITSAEARKLAEIYPAILEAATVTADGQVALNQAVVDKFIADKEAEVKAVSEAEIQKLEVQKALLKSQLDTVQKQIEAAELGSDAEIEAANRSAGARMLMQQAVLTACEKAGIDEETANEIATAAMLGDWDRFTTLATKALTNLDDDSAVIFSSVMSNFATTASNLVGNTNEVINAFNAMGDALKAALEGGDPQETYVAKIGYSVVEGTGKEAVGGIITGMWDAMEAEEGEREEKFGNQVAAWQQTLQDLMNTYAAGTVDIDGLKERATELTDQIADIDSQIALLRSLQNISLEKLLEDSGSKDAVEEYTATIEKYRAALLRLEEAKKSVNQIEQELDNETDLKKQILLQRELAAAYKEQQEAQHNLNDLRDGTINANVDKLRGLGFEIDYDADENVLYIANLEHLNELVADSKGEYDSLQEATNEYRKEVEQLIEDTVELNENNQEGSESWWELKYGIDAAKTEISELLKTIVENASDAVDSIQDVYDTLHTAADEYAESGYVSIDTLQEVIGLGTEYVAFLIDENGNLEINEERIRDVINARTEQLAIESSLSYIEALRLAQEDDDLEKLNYLLTATEGLSGATWDLVYANLALLDLDGEQYEQALANVNAIRAMAENAMAGVTKYGSNVADEIERMREGLNNILDYVMEMIKQKIQDQVDALEEMKETYGDIIEQEKERLRNAKEEEDRQKSTSDKLKQMAKLQAQIDILGLDSSAEANAKKAALLEELAELQEELDDEQREYMLEQQEATLDKMQESYEEEKDAEIEKLEESISSHQKLYDMAIDYISNNWSTLYSELLNWNYKYGNDLSITITNAWNDALKAAQEYGSFVDALDTIGGDSSSGGTSAGTNTTVGKTHYSDEPSNTDMISAIVEEMKGYSAQWSPSNTKARNDQLHEWAAKAAAKLPRYGVKAKYTYDGDWIIEEDKNNPGNRGKLLYSSYHTGGIVGGGSIKDNERFALLKEREWVLSEQMVRNLSAQIDRINRLSVAISNASSISGKLSIRERELLSKSDTINNITNNSNRPIEVTFGDTIIHGASGNSVEKHIQVSRETVNEIARLLGLKM